MDSMKAAIDCAVAKLRELEVQVVETKKTINGMCKLAERPLLFPDADASSASLLNGFRSDQFYGQPLSTVARQILDARKASGLGAASVNEIYEAMVAGGYKFETSNVDNAKRVLRISLAKNSATFHKLPNGEYGLRTWYPAIKDSKAKAPPGDESEPEEDASATDSGAFDFKAKEESADAASA